MVLMCCNEEISLEKDSIYPSQHTLLLLFLCVVRIWNCAAWRWANTKGSVTANVKGPIASFRETSCH